MGVSMSMLDVGVSGLDEPLQQSPAESSPFLLLPREIRDKVYNHIYVTAIFKFNLAAVLTKDDTTLHSLLFACRQIRTEAFAAFLALSKFRIDRAWMGLPRTNDHHLYIRRLIIDGQDVHANILTLRTLFPRLCFLEIHYRPSTRASFDSLTAFASCKRWCCGNDMKNALLNVFFFGADRSEEFWISNLVGAQARLALEAARDFELSLVMRVKTDGAPLVR
jgi:hypothetical protein